MLKQYPTIFKPQIHLLAFLLRNASTAQHLLFCHANAHGSNFQQLDVHKIVLTSRNKTDNLTETTIMCLIIFLILNKSRILLVIKNFDSQDIAIDTCLPESILEEKMLNTKSNKRNKSKRLKDLRYELH